MKLGACGVRVEGVERHVSAWVGYHVSRRIRNDYSRPRARKRYSAGRASGRVLQGKRCSCFYMYITCWGLLGGAWRCILGGEAAKQTGSRRSKRPTPKIIPNDFLVTSENAREGSRTIQALLAIVKNNDPWIGILQRCRIDRHYA